MQPPPPPSLSSQTQPPFAGFDVNIQQQQQSPSFPPQMAPNMRPNGMQANPNSLQQLARPPATSPSLPQAASVNSSSSAAGQLTNQMTNMSLNQSPALHAGPPSQSFINNSPNMSQPTFKSPSPNSGVQHQPPQAPLSAQNQPMYASQTHMMPGPGQLQQGSALNRPPPASGMPHMPPPSSGMPHMPPPLINGQIGLNQQNHQQPGQMFMSPPSVNQQATYQPGQQATYNYQPPQYGQMSNQPGKI